MGGRDSERQGTWAALEQVNCSRRFVLQAGAAGLVGLGCSALAGHSAAAEAAAAEKPAPPRDVIWDLHCHLSGVPGQTPQQRIARLLEFADRLGIERLCLYMGLSHSQNPTPQRLREENDQVLAALEGHHDRVFGFVYVSGEHPEASVAEIDRCVRDGPMVGIKLWV